MIIYPAIDIRGGRCVRLEQGRAERETIYSEDPAAMARQFKDEGAVWVHVVDLDGAFGGEPRNWDALAAISGVGLKVQFGGGLRSRAAVERALAIGASRVVIGTRAAESGEFVTELVKAFGGRIAVGIDAKQGRVAVKGWVDSTPVRAIDLARRMDAAGVGILIHTDVATDGMLGGPNFAAQEEMLSAVRCSVIASGGVGGPADIVRLREIRSRRPNLEGAIVGKALYEGRVSLREILK